MSVNRVIAHQPKPPYHHGDLARALLDAADKIIEEEGLEAFTLRSCARQAGVSHAAPAHHFKDRAGLLSAYAASIFRDLTAHIQQLIQEAGEDDYARLHALGLAYIRFALQRPNAFSLVFRCEALDKNVEELKEASDDCFQVLIDVVQALMPQANKETVLLYSMLAWSTVHGFATLWLEGNFAKVRQSNVEPSVYADRLAQQILALIKPAFVPL
ncbi:MAG: TetR/AcrR family transcriptional regulator [Moraxellaceae bacterium]|nr:TetR/AcrR family transcriptional regulator [Pseudomonadales bacterium]MCB1673832.1 TetR/AcrR family transcriptional regulator [Pseudomonadales bacterium]MCP5175668.1 TetR/AcrR family transcriptional regulator [Moraxellaceae bacterium]MCP5178248.1 TetR/AcrR family transcriptional regulator [Moraxellaceae bacterium]HQV21838.1 TetR/AcrR family transcriptional regulator [Agitococcus sp.]